MQIPKAVAAFTADKIVQLRKERRLLTASIDREISELVGYLQANGGDVPAEEDDRQGYLPMPPAKPAGQPTSDQSDGAHGDGWAAARAIRKRIEARVSELLQPGVAMQIDDILKVLNDEMVPINTDNPKRRVVTILSDSDEFTHVRGLGWMLTAHVKREEQAPEESTPGAA